MRKQLSWRLSILAAVLIFVGAGSAAAQTTICSAKLTPGSYESVNVPAGQTCEVDTGTVAVAGNVTVGTGAALLVEGGTVTIAGNVTVETGATLAVESFGVQSVIFVVKGSLLSVDAAEVGVIAPGTASILGSVSLTGTTVFAGFQGTVIGGTLVVANSNAVNGIGLFSNTVAGSVLVQNNKTSGAGSDEIQNNTIGGSLVCAGNTPAPVDFGVPNTVGGAKVGQCAGL